MCSDITKKIERKLVDHTKQTQRQQRERRYIDQTTKGSAGDWALLFYKLEGRFLVAWYGFLAQMSMAVSCKQKMTTSVAGVTGDAGVAMITL
jgi:hypothetical protein